MYLYMLPIHGVMHINSAHRNTHSHGVCISGRICPGGLKAENGR